MKFIKTPIATALALVCASFACALVHAAPGQQSIAGGNAMADSPDGACTGNITNVPVTITAPGTWCLNSNISTSITAGNAITVDADGATIDCRNFMLDGSGGGSNTLATGISAAGRVKPIVRNCTVKGFNKGINFLGNSESIVEFNQLDSNAVYGVGVNDGASGDASLPLVRYNEVINTGGGAAISLVTGIYTIGDLNIIGNIISGVHGTDIDVYGIRTYVMDNSNVTGNLISGLDRTGSKGVTFGIYSNSGGGFGPVKFSGNTVEGDGTPGSLGISCDRGYPRNGVDVKDNTISHFETGLLRCKDRGGNVILP